MATEFPLSTYPLLQDGKDAESRLGVEREIMSDGTPKIWVLSADQWRVTPLPFAPLPETSGAALEQYLYDNSTTEFDIVIHGDTFTGYLWSDPKISKKDNNWHVTIDFYGRKTS